MEANVSGEYVPLNANSRFTNALQFSILPEPARQDPVRILNLNGNWLRFDPSNGFLALDTAIPGCTGGGDSQNVRHEQASVGIQLSGGAFYKRECEEKHFGPGWRVGNNNEEDEDHDLTGGMDLPRRGDIIYRKERDWKVVARYASALNDPLPRFWIHLIDMSRPECVN